MASTLWAVAMIAHAQQTGVVKEIVIRGNQRVSREAILATMQTKVGKPYSQETLDRDKRSIDELGFFQSVDVRGVGLEGNDWQVVVNLVEWPEVKEIRVVGNTVVKTEDILKAIRPMIKP